VVNQYLAILDIHETQQQFGDGSFTTAGMANQGNFLAWLNFKTEIFKQMFTAFFLISKANITQFNFAALNFKWLGTFRIVNFWLIQNEFGKLGAFSNCPFDISINMVKFPHTAGDTGKIIERHENYRDVY